MKAIMMSSRPKRVVKILNGEETKDVCKKFPKDFVGWVYIYCTKGNKNKCLIPDLQPDKVYHPLTEKLHRGFYSIVEKDSIWNDCKKYILNGKVVARFWCNKVEEYYGGAYVIHNSLNYSFEDLKKDVLENAPKEDKETKLKELEWYEQFLKDTQLTREELREYVHYKNFYAIHISKLEIFDKPKELGEFGKCELLGCCDYQKCNNCRHHIKLTNPPQNFCYVED